MINFFYFKFYALSQKVNGVGRHNHYYACLTLSFFEIVLFINGALLVHIFLGGREFFSVTKFLVVVIFLVVFLVNHVFFSVRSRGGQFLAEKEVALSGSSGHIGGLLSLLIPMLCMFALAYFFIHK